jgi:hypothetical protein
MKRTVELGMTAKYDGECLACEKPTRKNADDVVPVRVIASDDGHGLRQVRTAWIHAECAERLVAEAVA